MWAIRILTGSQAGHVIPLKIGALKIGRGPTCEVKIASASVSKEHAQAHVTEDKLIISDLNSRNGTFVNGVRVQRMILKPGDKVMLHDVIFDVLSMSNAAAMGLSQASGQFPGQTTASQIGMHPHSLAGHSPYLGPGTGAGMGGFDGNAAMSYGPPRIEPEALAPTPRFSANSLPDLWRAFLAYIDNVAMPGIYAFAKRAPFRYVIGAYVVAFVGIVTLLSTVPMAAVTKASIQAESQRRALTIARNLAFINRQSIIDGLDVSVTTQMAENEDGVESALVVSATDGRIIAPVNRAAYADKPYVLRVRKKLRGDEVNDREYVEQIDSSKIVASVPVRKFSGETGHAVAAYAVVIYDMGRLAMDAGETFSLLVQNLAIALTFGFILYFLLTKTIERPIIALNDQLDDALREGKDDIFVEFQFPELALLASNVNSALSRIGKSGSAGAIDPGSASIDRDAEAEALVAAIPSAAIAINAIDNSIVGVNDALYALIGGGVDLKRKNVTDIHDQAMQKHVRDLIDRLRENSHGRVEDSIPFTDGTYATTGIAISGANEPAFFLVVFNRSEGG